MPSHSPKKSIPNDNARVSVVIPTRNSEAYIREALDSILRQTFRNFEVIIVDDNSTDDTLKILREYKDPRVKILAGPGTGLAGALNFAIGASRSEFIARMDADDIAHETRLGKQVAFLDEHPDIGVCGTQFQQFMDGDSVHDHMEHVRYKDIIMGCYIGHPTVMFRRELFARHNLFYNEAMRFSEDYELWSRAIRITKLGNVPEVLLRYRRHATSASIMHMTGMHEIDISIKTGMIGYLVDGLTDEETKAVAAMLKGERAKGNDADLQLVAKLMASIKQEQLCSPLELLSCFHQIAPFSRDELVRLTSDIVKTIPIFIISYNHLSYLKSVVDFLAAAGFQNVQIIDNASTYPPLIQHLHSSAFKVHYMGVNYKHMVLFNSEKFREIVDNHYFILTDPDVLPIDQCPSDFVYAMLDVLLLHPGKNKVGLSLKIDDLPEHYQLKNNVIKWESQFWRNKIQYGDIAIYDAPVDTTFALYRPRKEWRGSDFYSALRIGEPYTARHLPWYRDLSNLNDEDSYYRSLDEGSSNWNGTMSSDELDRKLTTEPIDRNAEALKAWADKLQANEPGVFRILKARNTRRKILESGLFDVFYYLKTYPDVKAAKTDAVLHFISHGVRELRNPSENFSTSNYLLNNPDVLEAGLNPLVHYIEFGRKEGRRPN